MLTLRPYQREAVSAVLDRYWFDGVTRPVIVMATGGGKTYTAASLVKTFLEQPEERFLFLAHRDKLIKQAYDAFCAIFPSHELGIVQAHHDQPARRGVFASWDTLRQPRRLAQYLHWGKPSIIVVDECHHVPAKSYLKTLEALIGPETLVVGVTATPSRADRTSLKVFFQEIVFAIGLLELIQLEVLCDLTRISIVTDLDLSTVALGDDGDFKQGELEAAVAKSGNRYSLILQALRDHHITDQGIYFGASVADADAFTNAANYAGIPTALITGDTSEDDRTLAFEAFNSGALRFLANFGVLTEGTDLPRAKVAIMGRHTKSQELYLQMAGRICRRHPDDEDKPYTQWHKGLVLDVADNHHTVLILPDLIGVTERQMGTRSIKELVKEKVIHLPEERERMAPTGSTGEFYHDSLFSQEQWKPLGIRGKQDRQLRKPHLGVVRVYEDLAGYQVIHESEGGKLTRLAPGLLSRQIAPNLEKACAIGELHFKALEAQEAKRQVRREDRTPASPNQILKLKGLYPAWKSMTQADVQKAWDQIGEARKQGYANWWKSPFNRKQSSTRPSPRSMGKTGRLRAEKGAGTRKGSREGSPDDMADFSTFEQRRDKGKHL